MFNLTDQPIDPKRLCQAVASPASGGLVSFEGRVRHHNQGRKVLSLEYEAFPSLAEKEGNKILKEISSQYDIVAARCEHRVGHLEVGEIAVCIYVSAVHRDSAFKACRAIIDTIKLTVPIWKKEHYEDGTSSWTKCDACSPGLS